VVCELVDHGEAISTVPPTMAASVVRAIHRPGGRRTLRVGTDGVPFPENADLSGSTNSIGPPARGLAPRVTAVVYQTFDTLGTVSRRPVPSEDGEPPPDVARSPIRGGRGRWG
jgi:hypothetical protein